MLFLFPFVLFTCDKSALISLDSKYEKITFSCGEITINSHSTKAVYFDFILNFKTTREFKIYPKKIEITYLGEKVPYEIFYGKNKIDKDSINIINDEQMILEFSLLGNPKGTHNIPAKEGDTILIQTNNFLICDGKQTFKEPIILVVDKIN